MTLRRASLILPCQRLDDFPSHLTGGRAAELIAGWTSLWHPVLIDAIGAIPGWRASDELPDPSEFDGELLVLPESSSLRMSADWRDRLRTTNPQNPSPVDVGDSRQETVNSILFAAGIDGIDQQIEPGPPVNKNIYKMSHRERRHLRIDDLPANLSEALDEFEKDDLVRETLGEHIFNHFLEAKREEWADYIRHVSPWEMDRYLGVY